MAWELGTGDWGLGGVFVAGLGFCVRSGSMWLGKWTKGVGCIVVSEKISAEDPGRTEMAIRSLGVSE